MTEKKDSYIEKTYIYDGMGFPVTLHNIEMKEFYGEYVPVIDRKKVADSIMQLLCQEESKINSDHLLFIRDSLQMNPAEFAKFLNHSEQDVERLIFSPEPIEMDSEIANSLKQSMRNQMANKKDNVKSQGELLATKGVFSHSQKETPKSPDVSQEDQLRPGTKKKGS